MNDTGSITFTAATDLEPYRRVKLTAARTVGYAGLADKSIGVTTDRVASGGQVTVRLWNHPGSFEISVAKAIAAGVKVYGAANGQITDAANAACEGFALEATDAADQVAEVVETSTDAVQSALVADLGAGTAANPAAITYVAPAGGGTVDAEGRASLAQSAADVAAIRAEVVKLVTDIASIRTKLNAALAALKTAGLMASA